ncbi:hypothetical protein EGI22_16080 [Lacihabitans sp. LS3-19]|uniref:hypothetical protein n=1 Tax=Lacihabitans sp. LS3-19 TaxID=2487335 RepID=UPI0020CE6569|nr:hypothetical protein [Lacihabitans sp. LS3-19]MCP9769422.1 hypothetical protein [Lacihabitans sp. LS3-19]
MTNFFTKISLFVLALMLYGCAGCSKRNDKDEQSLKAGTQTSRKKKPQELSLSLYIENSGSMLGYDGPQNSAEFKSAVAQFYNSFGRIEGVQTPQINYVNENVQTYQGDFSTLLRDNIFNHTRGSESRSTDFALIFNRIIENTQANTVSVLFSDLIYSDVNNAVSNAENLLSKIENLTATAFNNTTRSLSIIIVQFNGNFNGAYYPYNSPGEGRSYTGNRPFYMVVLAQNHTMQKFLSEEKYTQVASFSQYNNFKDLVYFSSNGLKDSPKYSILDGDPNNRCTFSTGGKSTDIHAIKELTPPRSATEKLRLAIGISLPSTVFSKSEIDTANFEIKAVSDRFKIIRLEQLMPARKSGITHRLILEAQDKARGEREVEIRLRKGLPMWVQKSNSTDDRNFRGNFSTQTFGIARLIEGIQNTYSSQNNYTFILKLNLNENN